MDIANVVNIAVVGIIPIMYKLIKDINALIVKIETQEVEINNIKEDIRQLGECLHEFKLKLIKQ